MVKVEPFDWWYKIDDIVCYKTTNIHEWMIHLAWQRGEDMVYETTDAMVVNYPWEFEKNDLTVTAVETHEGMMHYVVYLENNTRIGIVQHSKALSHDAMTDCEYRLITDPKIWEKLTRMEYEGKQIVLE